MTRRRPAPQFAPANNDGWHNRAVNDDGWHNGAVPVTLTVQDTTAGVLKTEYSMDGGAWQPILGRRGRYRRRRARAHADRQGGQPHRAGGHCFTTTSYRNMANLIDRFRIAGQLSTSTALRLQTS